jgi:hypothetical protein
MSAENNKEEKDGTTSPDDRFERKHDPFVNKQDLEVLMEASDGGPNPKKKRFGYGAIILLAVAAKILIWPAIQTAFYEFKHRSGHGWDDSKAEFQKYYEDEYKKFGSTLPVKYAADLANCQSNSYVAWLNKSECRRYRISFLTSAAEHERRTAACLLSAGESEFVKVNAVDCVKQIIPNKWSEFESVYAERFFKALQDNPKTSRSEADTQRLSGCIAEKYVEKMTSITAKTGSDCEPMNLAGVDLESVLNRASCQHVNVELEILKFLEACLAQSITTAH